MVRNPRLCADALKEIHAVEKRIRYDAVTPCKNCDTPIEARFCPHCGQKDIDLERPLSELLAGRRRLYSPPFRLYLVVSVLFFILTAWVAGQGVLLSEGQTLEADAVGQARLFADYVLGLMFFLLPVFALLLKVAFRERFYFDHLIHSLHLHSVAYIVLAFMLPLDRAANELMLALVIQSVLFIYMLASFVISIHHVYRAGWLVATAKITGILLGYMALIAGSFEAVSYFMMPGSATPPFLAD